MSGPGIGHPLGRTEPSVVLPRLEHGVGCCVPCGDALLLEGATGDRTERGCVFGGERLPGARRGPGTALAPVRSRRAPRARRRRLSPRQRPSTPSPRSASEEIGLMPLGPDRIDRVVHRALGHAHVDLERGWRTPFGPGTAASVDAATWFQWMTAPASASTGGAADAPYAPSAADATKAAATRLMDRRRVMMPPLSRDRGNAFGFLRLSHQTARVSIAQNGQHIQQFLDRVGCGSLPTRSTPVRRTRLHPCRRHESDDRVFRLAGSSVSPGESTGPCTESPVDESVCGVRNPTAGARCT